MYFPQRSQSLEFDLKSLKIEADGSKRTCCNVFMCINFSQHVGSRSQNLKQMDQNACFVTFCYKSFKFSQYVGSISQNGLVFESPCMRNLEKKLCFLIMDIVILSPSLRCLVCVGLAGINSPVRQCPRYKG